MHICLSTNHIVFQEAKQQSPMEQLTSLVSSLSIEPAEEELLPVSDSAKKFCNSKSEMETLVQLLYNRCLTDWKFARCAAHLCQRLMDVQVEQESLRTILLQTIQKDYKGTVWGQIFLLSYNKAN